MTERRVATETVTHKIDGVNTVVAEAGEVIPLGFEQYVPDGKSKPLKDGVEPTRSTASRRAAAVNGPQVESVEDGPKARASRKRGGE